MPLGIANRILLRQSRYADRTARLIFVRALFRSQRCRAVDDDTQPRQGAGGEDPGS
jgi:hypothetical protein